MAEGTPVVSVSVFVVVFFVKVAALSAVSLILLLAVVLGAAGRECGGHRNTNRPLSTRLGPEPRLTSWSPVAPE